MRAVLLQIFPFDQVDSSAYDQNFCSLHSAWYFPHRQPHMSMKSYRLWFLEGILYIFARVYQVLLSESLGCLDVVSGQQAANPICDIFEVWSRCVIRKLFGVLVDIYC